MIDIKELTIKKIRQGLLERKFSAVEITKTVFSQIEKKDKDIHAYLTLCEESALNQAKEIDKKIADGEPVGPLAGAPLAVKDNILVADIKATSGSKILENYIAPYDATVIKRLKEAGVIIVGKTNMDEFAMGSSTENSAFGPTKNPHDLERVPGGSSGGSTAAVAADECLCALGSDTGSSIRLPAAFCGVVGLKTTYGRVSRYGLMALSPSLDQIGPITKTTEDAEILLRVMEGHDEMDSTSVDLNSLPEKPLESIQDLRIGVPKEYFIEGLDEGVKEAVQNAIALFEREGAKVIEISLPHSEYALACYYIIVPAEISTNLSRHDGIRFGYSEEAGNLLDGYLKTRQNGFGDEARRRIMLGTYALSAGYYDAYYLKAKKIQALVQRDFIKAFEKVDVIMGPVAATPAFKLGERTSNPVSMYLSDFYTCPINLAGIPAVSVPCGKIGNLPIGLHIIGKHFEDKRILQIAKKFEEFSK